DSVIGMAKDEPLGRFVRRIPSGKFEPAMGPATLCAIAVETNDATGLAARVAAVRCGGRVEEARPQFWEGTARERMIPKSGNRFSEKDHAPVKSGVVWILPLPRPITQPSQDHSAVHRTRARRVLMRENRGDDVMAGHSQFKNIMHRKGRQDAVRSKLF